MMLKVYIYLAKKGPKREIDLSKALKLTDKKLDLILKNLQSKGLVTATVEQCELFLALPFEIVLDQLVKSRIQQASVITENKEEFLARWRSSIQKEDEIVQRNNLAFLMFFMQKSIMYCYLSI